MRSTILRLVKLQESEWYDDSPRPKRVRNFMYIIGDDGGIESKEVGELHADHRDVFGTLSLPDERGRAHLTPNGTLNIYPYYRHLPDHREDLENHFRDWHGVKPERVHVRKLS